MTQKKRLDEGDMFSFQLSRVPPKGWKYDSRTIHREDGRCAELGDPGYDPISSRLRQRKAQKQIKQIKNKVRTELKLKIEEGDELDELTWKKVEHLGKIARKKEEERIQRQKKKFKRALIAQTTSVKKPKQAVIKMKSGRQKLAEYACFQCKSDHQTEYKLLNHAISTGHFLQCGKCQLKVPTPGRMGAHLGKTHYMQCEFCKMKLMTIKTWRSHLFNCPNHIENTPLKLEEPIAHSAPNPQAASYDTASNSVPSDDKILSSNSQSAQLQTKDEAESDLDMKIELCPVYKPPRKTRI